MIIFHHIPKTAGNYVISAVVNGLADTGRPHSYYRTNYNDAAPDLGVLRASQGIVASHWAYDPKRAEVHGQRQEGDIYLTWVRDPVEMFFSGWEFYRNGAAAIPRGHHTLLQEQIALMWRAESFEQYMEWCVEPATYCFPCGQLWPGDPRLGVFDFVGRCERMTEDLWTLGRLAGFKPRLGGASARNASPRTVDRDKYQSAVVRLLMDKLAAKSEG